MKIINPLYDHAFKYLMQNDRIAKKVLSTLLECEVYELNIEQQEVITVDVQSGLKLFRLDFSATIVDNNGKKQKVLIELQKSKLPTNLLRFRSYLGSAYSKKEIIKKKDGKTEAKAYPIIAIYLLGYNVVDIPYLAISIDNKITNAVTKELVEVEDDFISLLTHKTRVIQIRRLSEKRKTALERFLMLFNQNWIANERYILDLEEIPEEFKDIAKYLQGPLGDDRFRKQLAAEEEIDELFKNQEAELAKREEDLKESKKREEEERRQKEEERRQKEEAKNNFAKYLLSEGKSIETIVQMTGLKKEVVLKLKSKK